ncbi:hypothetical protein Aph02nite_84160 [Actinoplanes philippinensis]|uniref:BNR repeat-like domain-containing protein n=1 Tax=Actinoplanes philippinensis TaxID=35752 RepID=A0A1I2L4I5_9ACTN|nr:hypothetical protein [Actinoplanes philippinensis]GIE82466.1 hypothetical protein Aph02nite_84160 [Actinoplanes philippinensis]SFF74252.1 hypothetical protein SAMN05421541_12027 [Actinoplanes philippinensis]
MREPQFDRVRSEVAAAVRQPEFSTVRQRAGRVRRRRAATTSGVFLVSVLAAASFGYTAQNTPPDYGSLDPVPVATCTQDCSWPWMTASAGTGAEVYGVVSRCEECDSELFVSPDGAGSWEARTVPPAPGEVRTPRVVSLAAPGPGLLVWREQGSPAGGVTGTQGTGGPAADPTAPSSIMQTWISRDGGRTWARPTATTTPADAVPAGSRPVDCDLVELPACVVGVLDPGSGRFTPLAVQPTGITVEPGWTSETSVPVGDRLWVPGLDPATRKPAVATSSDAGRTWRTHVFTDGAPLPADSGLPAARFAPNVAAGAGGTAYAVTSRADGTLVSHYTTDGGTTWQTGQAVERARALPGYVAADGSHIVATDVGASAARGTGHYTSITLSGMPEGAIRKVEITSEQAGKPYLMASGSETYLSADGRTWQQIRVP